MKKMKRTRSTVHRNILATTLLTALLVTNSRLVTAQTFTKGPALPGLNAAAADLDGDGKLDFVYVTSFFSNTIGVVHGNGDGTFGIPTTYTLDSRSDPFNSRPYSITLADVNNDGKLDILTANPYVSTISVLLGNGDGTFQPQHSYQGVIDPTAVVVADVNNDGIPDLIATEYDAGITILLGNGDGTFQPSTGSNFAGQIGNPYALALIHLNGDEFPDLVVRSFNHVSVLRGNGDGTFSLDANYAVGDPVNYNTVGSNDPYAIAVADLNGDGIADIVTSSESGFNGSYYTTATLDVLFGKPDGTFVAAGTYTSDQTGLGVTLADLNGDGKPEIITNTGRLLMNNGDGTFTSRGTLFGSTQHALVGDVNGDGKPDVLSGSVYFNNNNAHTLSGTIDLSLAANAAAQDVFFTFRPVSGAAFTRTAAVGPDGHFTLPNVPAGAYTAHLKGAKWLARNVAVDLSSADDASVNAALPAGDADNSNEINLADFGIMVNAYGSSISDPTSAYNAAADFNSDGTVDIADFGLLGSNYGSSGDL